MSPISLANNSVFAGRYRVVRRIASGGMGSVYEVEHIETERRRALKVMLPELVHSPQLRERFRLEARVAAHIESDFIVDVFDAGVDDDTGMPFLVMELLRGEDLRSCVRRNGPLAPDDVVRYLYQAALALDKTHRASIVHRDLKPENLFLNEREDGPARVKVLDFGIAKIIADTATQGSATREVIGTPLYMAPEQFDLSRKISPATDIYALGMIAFTLLAGKAYWFEDLQAGGNLYAFVARANQGPTEPPSARAARYGVTLLPGFDAWFAQVTALSPADRFATASAAVLSLADALGLPRPSKGEVSAPQAKVVAVMPEAVTATSAATTLLRTQPPRAWTRLNVGIAMIAALGATITVIIALSRYTGGSGPPGTSTDAQASAQANGATSAPPPPAAAAQLQPSADASLRTKVDVAPSATTPASDEVSSPSATAKKSAAPNPTATAPRPPAGPTKRAPIQPKQEPDVNND